MRAVCLLLLAGCAEEPQPVLMTPADAVVVSEHMPPPEPARAPTRPRLSQTVTLGQTGYSEMPPPAAEATAPGVVVNNNVTVVNQPPVVWGGYYGYGYGYGGGGYGGYAPREAPRASTPSTPSAPAQYTPPVGGDWHSPPSYGPAPMR